MNKFFIAIIGALALALMLAGCNKETVPTRNADLTVTYFGKEIKRERPTWYTAAQLKAEVKIPGKKYVVFGAPWCKACSFLRRALDQADLLDKVIFINVDDTFANHLSQFYGVRSVPTMLEFGLDGKLTNTKVGPGQIVTHLLIHTN